MVCPCGSGDCYWVRGSSDVLESLKTFVAAQTSQPYQPVFITYQGRILDEPTSGFAADYEGYQLISGIQSISVAIPGDCPAS